MTCAAAQVGAVVQLSRSAVQLGWGNRMGGPPGAGKTPCDNLPMQDVHHVALIVTISAFLLAAIFGAVANRVNFCTMGAISDFVNFGDSRRLRMWLLAV